MSGRKPAGKNGNQFQLLASRRFAPLFATQFLGAFHDNIFKNALVVVLLFDSSALPDQNTKILTTLAMGLFILPFVLFSGLGGQLAAKFPKDRVIRAIKLAEILIAISGALSLLGGSVLLSFVTLFALGTHSALFGPGKYSILPQHLMEKELIGGNALLNTGTFLAILAGTIAGTGLITLPWGREAVCLLLLACSLCGYVASRFIPAARPETRDLKITFNPLKGIFLPAMEAVTRPNSVGFAVLGIAWFYFMGGMFMAQLPNFVRESLNADEYTLMILLVLFSIGIALGGLFNNRLLRGEINTAYVPLAMLAITLFSTDLYFSSSLPSGELPVRTALDVIAISIFGGLFVVPLNAFVQDRTPEKIRPRIIAGNAIINSLFIVASSALSAHLIFLGFEIRELFLIFAVANGAVALILFSPLRRISRRKDIARK